MVLKSKKNSIAVIIPMRNEEKVAAKCIEAVMDVIITAGKSVLLIVINDGSEDKTAIILEAKKRKYGNYLIVLNHKQNKGYGGALQSGINKAIDMGYEWALHMDSDLTNDPKYIMNFIQNSSDEFDCIKASRYIKGSEIKNVPAYRRLISLYGNYFSAIIFNVGIKDCTNGFRMVRLAILKDVKFREVNFSIILEEMYLLKKKKARFKEIPYKLTARTDSQSHFIYRPKIFYDYFKYVVKAMLIR